MSDEEKKAIEVLQYVKNETPFIFWYEDKPYNRKETINTILNLIEKQTKEIEELKNADLTTVYLNGFYDGEKKVKDKIKVKIEEYDDKEMTVNLVNRIAGKTFQQAVRNEVRKVLQYL